MVSRRGGEMTAASIKISRWARGKRVDVAYHDEDLFCITRWNQWTHSRLWEQKKGNAFKIKVPMHALLKQFLGVKFKNIKY